MAAVMIDTAEFVEELEKEGIEHKQARAFVNVLRRSQEVVLASQIKALEEVSVRTTKELDSKTEKALTAFQHDVKQRFAESKNDMDQRFVESKNDMNQRFAEVNTRFTEIKGELTLLRWMLGVLITGVAGLIIRAFFMP